MEQEQVIDQKEEAVEVEVADPSIKEQGEQEVEVVQTEQEEQTETKPEQKEDELESYSKNVQSRIKKLTEKYRKDCLLYTSPSPRDGLLSRMPSSA